MNQASQVLVEQYGTNSLTLSDHWVTIANLLKAGSCRRPVAHLDSLRYVSLFPVGGEVVPFAVVLRGCKIVMIFWFNKTQLSQIHELLGISESHFKSSTVIR